MDHAAYRALADNHNTVLGVEDIPEDSHGGADNGRANGAIADQLHAQETFYRNIIEGAADLTTLIEPDGTILYASAARGEKSSIGYDPKAMEGRNCMEIMHPDDRPALQRAIASDLAGTPTTVEMRVRKRDGSWMWVEMRSRAILGLDGKTIIVAYSRNIDERKRVERDNAALAAIVESSDDAITSISLDRIITYWNRGAEKMFGFSAAEMIGKPFTRFFPREDRTYVTRMMDQLIAQPDKVFRFDRPNRRRDGATLELSTVCFAIRNREGNVVGISAIQRDLSIRRQAERKAALLAAIVNASQDAILNLSPDSRILFWNPAAERVYGFSAKEAIGRGTDLFLSPEELVVSRATIRQVAETRESISWEQTALNKEGKAFVSAVNVFPILGADGKVSSVAGIGRDITALKETERQLVAAREAALAASQAKSEFLASMSHEIRTPMTAILGMAELVAEGELNPEQRRYVEILDNNGHALLDLINSILDLAKIESGRLTLERVGFDLSEVVIKANQTLAIRAHAKGLELIVSIAPDVPAMVLGDPLRLRQVLINLIGNAIKFTEQGEVLVSVERDSAPGEPIRLKFNVRDTGIGIAADKLPLLFDAFSQADSSTARKYGGSGLGLAIVKRLVDLMQGEVTLESEFGKGSTFSFISPFETDPSPAAAAVPWPDLSQAPALLVVGNETERTILREVLSGKGATVTEVASYEEGSIVIARAVQERRPPRFVLMDAPGGSPDIGAMEQLIAAASDCGASIIAMIHCDNLAADTARLKSLKLDSYLIKPIDLRELAKVVRHVTVGGETIGVSEVRSAATMPSMIVDRPVKILFADDSIDNRTLIRMFLKKTPYHLDEVENGRQAIDRFIAAGDYDLVLMDIQMPEVDGYAATRAIRDWERDGNHEHTPIIALTASVFPEAIRLTTSAGCDGHLGKPISRKILLSAIHDTITGSPRNQPALDTAILNIPSQE